MPLTCSAFCYELLFFKYFTVLIIICLLPFNCFGADLSPTPQEFIPVLNAPPVKLDGSWEIVYDDVSLAPDEHTAKADAYRRCADELRGLLEKRGLRLTIQGTKTAGASVGRIVIGNPLTNAFVKKVCSAHQVDVSTLPYSRQDTRHPEAYILNVALENGKGPAEIVIAARGPAGVFYGLLTLDQLIGNGRHGSAGPDH